MVAYPMGKKIKNWSKIWFWIADLWRIAAQVMQQTENKLCNRTTNSSGYKRVQQYKGITSDWRIRI